MSTPGIVTAFTVAVIALFPIPERSWAQSANVQLSLTREYGRALFSQCRLDVSVIEGKGRSAVFCSRMPEPGAPGNVHRDRPLTTNEVGDILKLSRGSELFAGGHIGTDSTAVDGLFETLKVSEAGRTAVLVASGNDTFTSGSRRELIRLLHSILNELQKAATQE